MIHTDDATAAPVELALTVPTTPEEALDPGFLSQALAPVGQGAKVTGVEVVEVIRTMATKIRFKATFDGAAGTQAFCLKGLLGGDLPAGMGTSCVLEGDFYTKLAPRLNVRVPRAISAVTDRVGKQSVLLMHDVIAEGGRFGSALEAFTADQAADSVTQLARLHAGSGLLKENPWIDERLTMIAHLDYLTGDFLSDLLAGERGDNLSPMVRDGAQLVRAMHTLAERVVTRPQFLIHGDAHAGNSFRNAEGTGLIDWQVLQRGTWACDVAYHLGAVLSVEVAEKEERNLLNHYLDTARGLGVELPDAEEAWLQYREAFPYGFCMWAMTRKVDPPIIVQFTDRLGRGVMRHDSYALLGLV